MNDGKRLHINSILLDQHAMLLGWALVVEAAYADYDRHGQSTPTYSDGVVYFPTRAQALYALENTAAARHADLDCSYVHAEPSVVDAALVRTADAEALKMLTDLRTYHCDVGSGDCCQSCDNTADDCICDEFVSRQAEDEGGGPTPAFTPTLTLEDAKRNVKPPVFTEEQWKAMRDASVALLRESLYSLAGKGGKTWE